MVASKLVGERRAAHRDPRPPRAAAALPAGARLAAMARRHPRSAAARRRCSGSWRSRSATAPAASCSGRPGGAIVSVIVASSPITIHLGQFARGYTAMMAAAFASLWLLLILVRTRHLRWVAPYALCALLLVAAHPFGLFALASELVLLVVSGIGPKLRHPKHWREEWRAVRCRGRRGGARPDRDAAAAHGVCAAAEQVRGRPRSARWSTSPRAGSGTGSATTCPGSTDAGRRGRAGARGHRRVRRAVRDQPPGGDRGGRVDRPADRPAGGVHGQLARLRARAPSQLPDAGLCDGGRRVRAGARPPAPAQARAPIAVRRDRSRCWRRGWSPTTTTSATSTTGCETPASRWAGSSRQATRC